MNPPTYEYAVILTAYHIISHYAFYIILSVSALPQRVLAMGTLLVLSGSIRIEYLPDLFLAARTLKHHHAGNHLIVTGSP